MLLPYLKLEALQVLVMSGLPGSGKSTVAEELRKLHGPQSIEDRWSGMGVAVVSSDDHFIGSDGQYRFISDELSEAHKACWRHFESAMTSKYPLIIVDNTNLYASEIAPYYLPAEARGYAVKIIRVNCDPADAFERQRHNVPAATFQKMVEQWKKRDVVSRWNVEEVTR